jgi:aminomethyltransferase
MDLSYLGKIEITGQDRNAFLSSLVPFDAARIKPGRGRQTLFLEDSGTIQAEGITWNLVDSILLTVTSTCHEWLLEYLFKNICNSWNVTIQDQTEEWAIISIHGRRAQVILQRITDLDLGRLPYLGMSEAFVGGVDAKIFRVSLTGEEGFECLVRSGEAEDVWDRIMRAGGGAVFPIGIGARDTLRIEAGIPCFEMELAGGVSPLEAGLETIVDMSRKFPGKEALVAEKKRGIRYTQAGLVVDAHAIPRPGCLVFHEGVKVGFITSSTLGPTVGKVIAIASIKPEPSFNGTEVHVKIRNREYPARIVTKPFYAHQRR